MHTILQGERMLLNLMPTKYISCHYTVDSGFKHMHIFQKLHMCLKVLRLKITENMPRTSKSWPLTMTVTELRYKFYLRSQNGHAHDV